jgi:hypothetical protein
VVAANTTAESNLELNGSIRERPRADTRSPGPKIVTRRHTSRTRIPRVRDVLFHHLQEIGQLVRYQERDETTDAMLSDTRTPEPLVVDSVEANHRERRGRRWLVWSFIFCPCHLPISMAVLAVVFGGSAFGTLISRNTLGVGIVFGLLYAAGVAVGFWHLRAGAAGKDCASGSCEI